ncbi:MAG: UDP-N-acetylmuramoyl-tripeptide--D-alanyl-D-alanine ligase [Deltaproteobacteria bacterium]|nr:UDP-N-acetylmuramoyl-tripeptide--D-alanyl-D-alanine ligase [Deltaproteobacteria bacterium]
MDRQDERLCTVVEAAEAAGGRLVQGLPATDLFAVSTDSRTPAPGALFVALAGEHFDGARFCGDAVEAGAVAVMLPIASRASGRWQPVPASVAVVEVEDTLRALGDLAAWHRGRHGCRVVGITGSNGKTTTKEMTVSVLGGAPDVAFNRGNFNNLIGMPLSLLGLRASHRHAVLEMGMNAPGEIARLAEIARPQVGVLTNVHPVHLLGLGGIEAVSRAKAELLEALPASGVAVINADDPFVLKAAERSPAQRLSFGTSPVADVRIGAVRQEKLELHFVLKLPEEEIELRLPHLGLHNAHNAAAAAAVGVAEGVAPAQIAERLARAAWPPMRMERKDLGVARLLVDCYNANPRSVHAAIQTLTAVAAGERRLAVLGDMLELGEATAELHRQTGHVVAEAGLDALCAFGPAARDIARGARDAGMQDVLETESVDAAVGFLLDRLGEGAWVLVKGSRGMRMERIVEALEKRS